MAFGEKVRLYFSKERRNNHESCYRRAKINKSAVSCLCMFRVASGERGRERYIEVLYNTYIHTYNNKILIAKRGPGAKKRENFTGAARSFQIS